MGIISLSEQIQERYRQYLQTTFFFKDPELRSSFENTLKNGRLNKGPYLEATPIFQQGASLKSLFTELLQSQPDMGLLNALQSERPLYTHQEAAIRTVCDEKNVLVATGTGSGKTESFLYPILLHLYREHLQGSLKPGVRALILYPMNALANDQRDRLREISNALQRYNSLFKFTFGQYIGETPENEAKTLSGCPGELVSRAQMRMTPPHILLTNYSMLEYLLLRPDDSPLFDQGNAEMWKFIVLDEAHQYRGSNGTEMSMLVRRLKQRIREGGQMGDFRCIATSASLAGDDKDRAAVAQFATDLFGENFDETSIILGEVLPIPVPGNKQLSISEYMVLNDALKAGNASNDEKLKQIASYFDITLSDNQPINQQLGNILNHDCRVAKLRNFVSENPLDISNIAKEIFPELLEEERLPALESLVDILVKVEDPVTNTPLLSARYHLFLRALEGAFISLWPNKKVILDRKTWDGETTAFEVALCRECGQHYFVGRTDKQPNKLEEPQRDPNLENFGITYYRPIDDSDEIIENDGIVNNSPEFMQLCIQCGALGRNTVSCNHGNNIRIVREKSNTDNTDKIQLCGACGYGGRGVPDPVREVIHGSDGPNVVIATTLYQNIDPGRRKILAFADGRQEAAFFAWYLEKSYNAVISRGIIWLAAQSIERKSFSLGEIAESLVSLCKEKNIVPSSTTPNEKRKDAWTRVYSEFLTDQNRISLSGVGLIHWEYAFPDYFTIPPILYNAPWLLSQSDATNLIRVLLDTMRSEKAVNISTCTETSVNWNDLQMTQICVVTIEEARLQPGERKWSGKTGKRVQIIKKILRNLNSELTELELTEAAQEILREIWQAIIDADKKAIHQEDRIFITSGNGMILNSSWWRLNVNSDEDDVCQCQVCGRISGLSISNICLNHHCSGKLQTIKRCELHDNHYRNLYLQEFPGVLRVEEHTGQLSNEKAREFQQDFKDGKINVLSCSTTFELGVDLGNLDNIFLRNVPPESFNYAQRVGRSGRRQGYPGFVVTYCRRSPHDLYHFSKPERMLRGKISPPFINLSNKKIINRHIAAVAFSHFFRLNKERFKNVASLFIDCSNPSALQDLQIHIKSYQNELSKTLQAIIPISQHDVLGLNDDNWITNITGTDSRLKLYELELQNDFKSIQELKQSAINRDDFRTAQYAKQRVSTIEKENALSFLSRKAIIPKYGFPVDTVELELLGGDRSVTSTVSLQRDLSIAIAEFAPTNSIIANKQLWTSYAIKRVIDREWDLWWYGHCTSHHRFVRGRTKDEILNQQCCNLMTPFLYIDPVFGFVTSRMDGPKEPTGRPNRTFSTRPFFAGFATENIDNTEILGIRISKTSPGKLVVINEGNRRKGFYICAECGAGFKTNFTKPHKSPHGNICPGRLKQVSLGHEFETDILKLHFLKEPDSLNTEIDRYGFAYSLAYTIVEGAAEILDIPTNDINATVAFGNEILPPIILFDNVPGGAGLVARLEKEEILKGCLEYALQRVSGDCGCDEGSSCYGCLRSYRNQFAHQDLKRGPVKAYLESLLNTL